MQAQGNFTKLFGSITESTIWVEPYPTRIVWVSMLAMADHKGRIFASVPGLARRAAVTLEECEIALRRFQEPDKYSRTPDNEGRRIEPIDGGWRLLNYDKYREARDKEERRDYQRQWDRENRSRSDKTRQNPTPSDSSDTIRQNPTNPDKSDQSEVDVEVEAEKPTPPPQASTTEAPIPPPVAVPSVEAPEERVLALAAFCIAKGIRRASSTEPHVRQWAAEGVTTTHIASALEEARREKPDPEPVYVRYLVPIVARIVARDPQRVIQRAAAAIAAQEAARAA